MIGLNEIAIAQSIFNKANRIVNLMARRDGSEFREDVIEMFVNGDIVHVNTVFQDEENEMEEYTREIPLEYFNKSDEELIDLIR